MRHPLSSTLLVLALGLVSSVPVVSLNAGDAPAPATSQPAESTWTMSTAERQALDAVVERAIAAGMPDPKGGTFLHGKVNYEMVLNHGGTTHRQKQRAEGLHLRLADGRLLMNLRWLVPTAGEGAVDVSGLQEVAPDKLNELGTKHRHFAAWEANDPEAELKRLFAESEMPKARAASARSIRGLLILAMGNQGDLTMPSIIFLRLQVPGAEHVALAGALNWLWSLEGSSFMEGKAVPLGINHHFDQQAMWEEQAAKFKNMRNLTVPDPARVLRLGAVGYFLSPLLSREQHWGRPGNAIVMAPEKTGEAALSLLDPSDPNVAEVRAEIARLVQRATIPEDIDVKADLATILRWWGESRNQVHEMSAEQMEQMLEQLDNLPAEHRASMMGSLVLARLQKVPLGDLVALVPDAGVSRWLDQSRVRTIGDNALRALAMRLGVDPRVLIGRDPKVPWTPEERTATASALATWWAANREKPVNELLAGALGVMSVPDLAALVNKTPDKERVALLTDIAKRWAAEAPKNPDPAALGALLRAAKESKALDAVVTTWPVSGRQRSLLATWHLEQLGNAAHLDALLAEAIKPPEKTTDPATTKETQEPDGEFVDEAMFANGFSRELTDVLRIVSRHPNPDRLVRLMTLFTAPAKDDDGSRIFSCVNTMSWGGNNDGLGAWWDGSDGEQMHVFTSAGNEKPDQAKRARAAMPLVFNGLLLNDQRPAPKQLAQQFAGWFINDGPGEGDEPGKAKEKKPLAQDLRLADLAAVAFPNQTWQLGLEDLAGEQAVETLRGLRIDLTADKATRDQVISKQRAIIATALPLALKAANLPTAIPGVTDAAPAAGDDVPAF